MIMTIEPLKLGFTQDEFSTYCAKLQMGAWRPRGVVLHNTAQPTLAQVNGYISSGKWRFDQLIDNWWVRYKKLGWSSGPNLFIHDKIWVATPLTIRGTHSPSFNATHWGAEIVGDYSTETLPDNIRANAVHAGAVLLAMSGHEASPQSVKFHNQDPRTTHHGCPGKNIGTRDRWEADIERRMAELHPGEHFAA